jgi:1,4-alpha-glucan branching enzyme
VAFRFAAPADSQVFLAGSFNGWSTDEHALTFDARSGFHQTALALPSGRHEYKFVVNGTWVADPSCPDWVPNEHGSLNSVLVV